MRVSIIGFGYLGLTHAACMAELGFEVLGVEVDPVRYQGLCRGELPLYEPGLQPLLARVIEEGRLRITDSVAEAARFADVHFICVGTPQSADGLAADTSAVFAVAEEVAREADRDVLLVGKSTVPVGTAAELERRLAKMGANHVRLAWNPEFLREGHAVEDTLSPDRLVFGVRSRWAEDKLREVYASLLNDGVPLVVTDFQTAELAKVSANAFLATKVSFINAIADLCAVASADVVELADIMGHDIRIGRKYLHAGVGFGGGCLPKDIRALRHRADELGVSSLPRLLTVVDEINDERHALAADTAAELVDHGGRLAILGASFKPHTDDTRHSPALWVARQLARRGYEVAVFDPKVPHSIQDPDGLNWADSVAEAAEGARLLVHLTDWPQFREIDPAVLKTRVESAVLLDCRNLLDRAAWREAGWDVHSLGRP